MLELVCTIAVSLGVLGTTATLMFQAQSDEATLEAAIAIDGLASDVQSLFTGLDSDPTIASMADVDRLIGLPDAVRRQGTRFARTYVLAHRPTIQIDVFANTKDFPAFHHNGVLALSSAGHAFFLSVTDISPNETGFGKGCVTFASTLAASADGFATSYTVLTDANAIVRRLCTGQHSNENIGFVYAL